MPLRQTLRPSVQLLVNGFTVIRFDPTNSGGLSDGNVADFTLAGLLDDLRLVVSWAAGAFAVPEIGVFAVSLSARAAFRAAAAETGLLRIVGSVAGVADVRATLKAVAAGEGHLLRWWARNLLDHESNGTAFGHLARVRVPDSRTSDSWAGAWSAAVDLAAAPGTRFVNVHGARDPVVAAARVLTTFAAARDSRVVLLPRAGHEFLPSQLRDALSVLVPEYRAALQGCAGGCPHRGTGLDLPDREPTIADLAACRQAESGATYRRTNSRRA